MSVSVERLERAVPRDARLAIDASAAIAYLHGAERASPVAAWIFDGCIATGRNPAVLSALTLAELLVGPAKVGPAALTTMEGFLRFFDGMQVVPLDEAIARLAARLRAATGLALPDAAVVATAIEYEASVVVTNDARWTRAVSEVPAQVTVLTLGDYVSRR